MLKAAADNVAPSVVQIRTIGGLDVVEGTVLADGPTTGLIISPDGYIISSAFNFAQQPTSILVTFAGGKQAPAELIATDHSRMLVLLKVNGVSDLPVAPNVPLAEIHPGQWAVAVGRTFRADRVNMTVGIISATNRMYGKVVQTDADVSTANYGGPLVDIHGRVFGVIVPMAPRSTSDVAGVEWYDSGIGFAAPLAGLAEPIERMKKGKDQRPGLLGIGMQPKSPHESPAELAVVRPDSPAGRAGLKKGDRIVEINGIPIHTQTDLRFALGTAYGGDSVRVVAKHGDERLERTIALVGEMPAFRHAFLGVLPLRSTDDTTAKKTGEKGDDKTEPKHKDTENSGEKKPGEDSSRAKESKSSSHAKESKSSSHGVVVRMVYSGSPAAEAGVQVGDRIIEINDAKIESIDDAIQTLNNAAPDGKVSVGLLRGDKTINLTLTAARCRRPCPASCRRPLRTKNGRPTPIKQHKPVRPSTLSCRSFPTPAASMCPARIPRITHSAPALDSVTGRRQAGRRDPAMAIDLRPR